MIKIQWLASIWRQNDQNIQNKAKLQKWSKSNELHRFDVKTIKTFKTKLNYKTDQNPMSCIDLTSKRSKCWVTSQNIQNKAKLQKWSKSNDLHRFDVQNDQNIQNKAKLQKWSKSNELHRFDVKTIKMLSYVAKHSKQSETTKVIQIQWLASIWRQNDQNVELRRKTFKRKLNYKSDQITIYLRQFDVKTIRNVELLRKTFKTTQNYESDQIIMNCIDWSSKRSKK